MDTAVPSPTSNRPTVPEILEAAAATYRERNALYKDNYKRIGSVLKAMFPGGIPPETDAEGWNRFALILMTLFKVSRYASQPEGHVDSAHDMMVYAGMLEEITPQGTFKSKPRMWYGPGGSLLSEVSLCPITTKPEGDFYENAYVVGESMTRSAARHLCNLLGGVWCEQSPLLQEGPKRPCVCGADLNSMDCNNVGFLGVYAIECSACNRSTPEATSKIGAWQLWNKGDIFTPAEHDARAVEGQ